MKHIKSISELIAEELDKMSKDVIITYDIDEDIPTFAENLRKLLEEEYKAKLLSKSTYIFKEKLTNNQIQVLINEILEKYKEFEDKDETTIIKIVQPLANQFVIYDIIKK